MSTISEFDEYVHDPEIVDLRVILPEIHLMLQVSLLIVLLLL